VLAINDSLDHLLIDLTTSKGMPRSRYSRVHPMRRLYPLKLGSPAAVAAEKMCLVNSALETGRKPPGWVVPGE
jgi:hypothetical protein